MNRLILLTVLSLLLTGCSTYTLVEGERVEVSDAFSVDPQISWNRLRTGHVELWTVDGHFLQALRFLDGVEDGHGLFETVTRQGDDTPPFKKDMTATDIQELVVSTLTRMGGAAVEASNLDPLAFGAEPGFRFDFSFISEDGLEMAGLAAGAVIDEKLYLILYTGARQHYFPRYRRQVEQLIGSVRTSI